MRRYCKACGAPLSNRSKRKQCKKCLSICSCGNPKDIRADQCRSCSSEKQTTQQWQDQTVRQKMMSGLRKSGIKRRMTFHDLSWETKWQKKGDGRRWAYIWDGDHRRTIYRYQWAWIVENGPIPSGHHIHHKNHDSSDDRPENLELMPSHKHIKLHGQMAHEESVNGMMTRVCENCGASFKRRTLTKKPARFCSNQCRIAHMRGMTPEWTCAHCGKNFKRQPDHGATPKYCSVKCFRSAHHFMT